MEQHASAEPAATADAPRYRHFVTTTFSQTVIMILRRRRTLLAAGIVLTPVLVPLAMAFLSDSSYQQNGNEVFTKLVEMLYLKALAPLLALFFGCMLVGEEVEGQTIPYLLTRPVPRSAWILGKYSAFLCVATALLLPSLLLIFLACLSLGGLTLSVESAKLLAHYAAVTVMALLGYGAFAILVGAAAKRPVIVGVVVLFGWQRLALYVPGLIDFFTIEKYINAMLPALPTERENVVMRTALMEFQKKEFLVGASKACVTLTLLIVALLLLTAFVVRWREYSSARAMGGR